MVESPTYGYKQQQSRYKHYYRQLTRFYQKPVAQVSTALLLTLFTVIFFAVFAIKPTLATIAELIKKIDDQREVLTQLERKSAALAVVQNEYAIIEDKIPLVDAALPKGYQAPELLSLIEALSAELNIPIQNLSVQEMTLPQEETAARLVEELPFTISFDAPYPQLEEIITLLNRLPRYITVQSLNFSSSGGSGSSDDPQQSPVVTVSISAVAYYQ